MSQEQQTNSSFSGILGRVLLLPLRAVVYVFNPCNWCNSSDKVKRDIRVALGEVKDGRPRILVHAEMSRYSAGLGMQFLSHGPGYTAFSIPERLAGKMHKVKQKKIDALQKEHPNINIMQSDKLALIEIDVPGIQKDLDPEKNKAFIRKEVAGEIHSNLKALMKMTGGDKIGYKDSTLIGSIAKLLFDSHNYIVRQEKVMSVSPDRSILVCVANKGIISIGAYSREQDDRKSKKSGSSNPKSTVSDIELSDLSVKRI
ncbi:hypothetical protein [Wolbachia endosymbiont of Folsomia candida]|uniref:hypothetical protein n=1 Tax=Wolbachia endosymbiont of Folsomia candida TaxID=169402 RepID=UPI000B0E6F3E|nr:hypothetical protein [Wolbachia endosymbiont of Folsomia candida]APR98460.1 hypothetical protein ASM33_04275 [Wolbachia endosymbiont of Folsomia candida]